jgi:hypothetical protein
MKPGKRLPFLIFRKSKGMMFWGERGQSIVEFVLLLSAVTFISWGFVQFMNSNLGRYWEYSANLIVNDKPGGTKKLNLSQ